jgi:hypothetical protein
MVLKRRFGAIPRLVGSIFGTHSASFFQKTNAHQLSANSLCGCSKDEVGSFGRGHREKHQFCKEFNLRREKSIYVRKTS